MNQPFNSFNDFRPYYLGEHSKPATRRLHCIGSFAAIGTLIALIAIGKWWLFPLAFSTSAGRPTSWPRNDSEPKALSCEPSWCAIRKCSNVARQVWL